MIRLHTLYRTDGTIHTQHQPAAGSGAASVSEDVLIAARAAHRFFTRMNVPPIENRETCRSCKSIDTLRDKMAMSTGTGFHAASTTMAESARNGVDPVHKEPAGRQRQSNVRVGPIESEVTHRAASDHRRIRVVNKLVYRTDKTIPIH